MYQKLATSIQWFDKFVISTHSFDCGIQSKNAASLRGKELSSAASTTKNLGHASLFLGLEVEHGGDYYLSVHARCFRWHFKHDTKTNSKAYNQKPIPLRITQTVTQTRHHSDVHGYPTPKGQPPSMTYSPPSHALVANFNSPQGRISPPPLGWGCPV